MSIGRVEKRGDSVVGGSWHYHISQAGIYSVTPSSLLVGGRGEAKKPQSCSVQMHMRALGSNPSCMLYMSLHSQNLQLLKVAWIGTLFYS